MLYAGLDKTAEVQRKLLKDDENAAELTLKCHIEGNPEPIVVWSRNKQRYVVSCSKCHGCIICLPLPMVDSNLVFRQRL